MTPNITEEVFFRNGCTTGKRKQKQMNGLRREKEELEIRQHLLDPDAELQRLRGCGQVQVKQEPEPEDEEEEKQEKEENERNPRKRKSQSKGLSQSNSEAVGSAPSVSSASGHATPNTPGEVSPCGVIIPHENPPDQQQPGEHRPKTALSLKWGVSNSPGQPHSVKGKKLLVDSVLNKSEDEDSDDIP